MCRAITSEPRYERLEETLCLCVEAGPFGGFICSINYVIAGYRIARIGTLEGTSALFCVDIAERTMRLTSVCRKICHSMAATQCFLPSCARITWPKLCYKSNFQPHREACQQFGLMQGSADMMHFRGLQTGRGCPPQIWKLRRSSKSICVSGTSMVLKACIEPPWGTYTKRFPDTNSTELNLATS